MTAIPAPGQILAAWWPCDRCAGMNPGVDAFGYEIPGPPVKLVNNSYLCGPCRSFSDDSPKSIVELAA